MYSKILVPLDGSPLAEQVLPHVLALAACHQSEVVLLRVVNYPLSAVPLSDANLEEEVRDCEECEDTAYLQAVTEKYFKGSNLKVEADLITGEGPVVKSILDYAEEMGAELIAMSTHGRTGISKWAFGSIAEKLLKGAESAILLIRAK